MAVAANFYINPGTSDFNLKVSGSGLGFYGSAGFGASVAVGAWNDHTFVTDGNGVVHGAEGQNVKWTHPNSGILGQVSSGTNLLCIPNYQSTLNIRVTSDVAILATNAAVRIYDRSNINNNPSGVTCRVAEIVHPSTLQDASGSGDSAWISAAGSGTTVSLVTSPGISGLYPNSSSSALQHDWFICLSSSPDSIGSKTMFGLYFSFEYA